MKQWFERKALSLWTYSVFFKIYHPSIQGDEKHTVTHCVFLADLKTDYTTALISPESHSILDVRASLTNECEALSYSLFVITTVTSTPPIWREAICFLFAFVPVIGSARLHGMFALSKFAHEIQSLGKVGENFFMSLNISFATCYGFPHL